MARAALGIALLLGTLALPAIAQAPAIAPAAREPIRITSTSTGPHKRAVCPIPALSTDPIICNITVTVRPISNWTRRCFLKVDPEVIVVPKVSTDFARVQLVWTLDKPAPTPALDYSFDPSLGIAIAEGIKPDVYDEPVESSPPVSTITVTYKKASVDAHNYNVHVMRKRTDGAWVACGAIDPLIVNTD